jgi:hypothetical protein
VIIQFAGWAMTAVMIGFLFYVGWVLVESIRLYKTYRLTILKGDAIRVSIFLIWPFVFLIFTWSGRLIPGFPK